MDNVTILSRFNGPPASANGGYAAGLVAEAIGPHASVRLNAPPPLDTPITRLRDQDGSIRLVHDGTTVAEGRVARPAVEVPPAPSFTAATLATLAFPGRRPGQHPWPGCFVCGPERHDGLRIYPGPLVGTDVLAGTWVPRPEFAAGGIVGRPFVWAALDCPSGFACMPRGDKVVLATMTAALEAPVYAGRPYVVTAWPITSEGRKHRGASALHDSDGRLVAVSESLWITLRAERAAA
jgi:hypothetical protein